MRRLVVACLLVAVAVVATAVPAHGATVRVQRFSGFRDVPIAATQKPYRLRVAYVVPGSWPLRGRGTAVARTFGPIGSCRFTLRVTAGTTVDTDEPAAARVARLVPQTGPLLLDAGTRGDGAWRVARTSGTSTVTGVLVRPAPSVRTPPASGRVWLELRFAATADPRRECHIGGPRTVGARTGDALATAALGGFEL
jgi:hypothetical protein